MAKPTGDGATPLDRRYLDPELVARYDSRYTGPFRALKGRRWTRLFRRVVEGLPGVASCMDIPCGSGYVTEALRSVVPFTLAADVSPQMAAFASERAGTPALVADIARLPFRDGAFDLIVNVRFMVHFTHEERAALLSSLARATGRYLLVNYNHRRTLKFALRGLRRRLGLGASSKDPAKKCTRAEVEEEARRAGLRVARVIPASRLLPFLNERWLVLFEKASAAEGS